MFFHHLRIFQAAVIAPTFMTVKSCLEAAVGHLSAWRCLERSSGGCWFTVELGGRGGWVAGCYRDIGGFTAADQRPCWCC